MSAADVAQILLQQYLSDKQRSGVVELGPARGGGAPRTLYIVPPSRTVCDELHVAWDNEVNASLAADCTEWCPPSGGAPP